MKLLLLETSTSNFSLAVSDKDKILRYRNFKLHKMLSDSIVPSIDKLLKAANMTLGDVNGFGIGIGPGSFTSLRIGLSTVKALSFATQKPIVGVNTSDVLAMGIKQDSQICSLVDAKRKRVFAAIYKRKTEKLKAISKPELTTVSEVLKKISEPTIFVGDGVGVYEQDLLKSKKSQLSDPKLWRPDSRLILPLVKECFLKKKYDDVNKLVPLYLYPKDCQVRR